MNKNEKYKTPTNFKFLVNSRNLLKSRIFNKQSSRNAHKKVYSSYEKSQFLQRNETKILKLENIYGKQHEITEKINHSVDFGKIKSFRKQDKELLGKRYYQKWEENYYISVFPNIVKKPIFISKNRHINIPNFGKLFNKN